VRLTTPFTALLHPREGRKDRLVSCFVRESRPSSVLTHCPRQVPALTAMPRDFPRHRAC
jgi:hypothetical protein